MATPASSFWAKPEGKLGAGVAALLIGAGIYGFAKILPFLLKLAANTTMLVVEFAVLATLLYVLFIDNTLRKTAINFYKRLMRAIMVLSFDVDPVGNLKVHMVDMQKRIEYAMSEIGKVAGQLTAVRRTIAQNKKDYELGLDQVEAARKRGMNDEAEVQAVIVGTAQKANEDLSVLETILDKSVKSMQEIVRRGQLNITMLQGVINIKERSFKATTAGARGMKAALAVLKGDADEEDRFQANLDYLDEKTSDALGEMDSMLEMNKHALDSVDLARMSYSDKAFKALEQRQQSAQLMLSSSTQEAQKVLSGGAPTVVPSATGNDDFSHLFTKGK